MSDPEGGRKHFKPKNPVDRLIGGVLIEMLSGGQLSDVRQFPFLVGEHDKDEETLEGFERLVRQHETFDGIDMDFSRRDTLRAIHALSPVAKALLAHAEQETQSLPLPRF